MGISRGLALVGLCVLLAGAGTGLWAGLHPPQAQGLRLDGHPWVRQGARSDWMGEFGRQLLWGPAPAWLLGLAGMAAPLAWVAVWVRGYVLGLAVASALGQPLDPVVLLTGLLVPHLLGCASALLAGIEACRLGGATVRAAVGIRPHELPEAFGRFLVAGLVCLLLALAAAALRMLAFAAGPVPSPGPRG